jgi:hypothetical protein
MVITFNTARLSYSVPFQPWGFVVLNHPDLGDEPRRGQGPPRRKLRRISNWRDRSDLGLNVQRTCRLQVRDA